MSIFEYNEEEEREKLRKAEYENGRQDGYGEGMHRGIARGKAEAILSLLEEYADIPSELQERILQEEDPERLTVWHRLAAKAESLDEFIERADPGKQS